MEGGVDSDAPLDYVEFQIFPGQNRYEACVRSSNKVEKVASGPLEHLLLHSPTAKDLYSKGSTTNFKIQPPDNLDGVDWFTTSTLTRFLHIVGSPDILSITNSIENEISQLEETRKFQLSLHVKTEVDIKSSDESKNELLRLMDLRLSALKEELVAVLNQATGASCSPKDISNLENFSHHFGAKDIRNSLGKFVELSPASQNVDFRSSNKFLSANDSRNGRVSKTESSHIPQLLQSDTPVKYGVSLAKVAQVERQSSTDSENSSLSSEEDQPSVERSRTLARSVTPRRSASPMRRIQIGRSGSRRAATLSIKSLNNFPARERVSSHRDASGNSSDEEDTEKLLKKSENNVLRMSVQDKISLFESKQRDQTVDIQKTKTLLNATVGAKKSVLRRWSSGMEESSTHCLPDVVSETSAPMTPKNVVHEVKAESDLNVSGCQGSVETAEMDDKSDSSEKRASDALGVKGDTIESKREENREKKNPASAEWSRQKEAELNQLFMKMMENKPVRQRNVATDNNKSKNSPKEQRGGFYNHYKQKRDEKLRGETSGKGAEKEAQFKVMHQFLDERKAEMASINASDVNRRQTVNKPQKSQKNSTQLTNSKKETSKPSIVKKATSTPLSLPAARKSWPSTPSPRGIGTLPAKTPSGPSSAGTTPTGRKPQPASSVIRSSTKVEKLQPQPKTVKATQNDANKSIKNLNEKKKQTGTKNSKTAKTKVRTPEEDNSSTAKPSFYNKVTKKSSVVPLETKPFLRKGSGIGPGVGPVVVKTKVVAQPEDSLRTSGGLIQAEENEVVTNTSDIVSQNQKRDLEAPVNCAELDLDTLAISPSNCEESDISNQVTASGDDGLKRIEMSEINTGTEEESIISPTAWVEIEEHQNEIVPCKESPIQIASPAKIAPVGFSSPRVRHSLSQMLLEESSETDIGEWGNAENPAMVYQKDAPKGFKRLLKFARKSKADSHLTGWSSPLAFSEGEDDAEESKAQSNISRFTTQNHQDGHVGASVTTTRATRSFFSLSAFRGSKPNETKLPYR